MRQVVMHTAGDVRVEEREDPKIIEPTDAIVRLTATCICGSDLWVLPRRRASRPPGDGARVRRRGRGDRLGGEEPQGRRLRRRLVRHLGQHLEICQSGYQSMCVHSAFVAQTIGTQSEKAQIPFADGTLVPTPGQPDPELIPSLLAASDVLGTGWFGAVAAEAGPGKTVAVVGDGAVGLMAILAAKQLGAERIAMSRHPERQELARFYGATDIVEERGDEGVAKVKELTSGLGPLGDRGGGHPRGVRAGRQRHPPGGHLGFVGVNYDVKISGIDEAR